MSQQTLTERTSAHIETMIVEGIYRPGEQLPLERTLSDQLGVSRPAVRQALKLLTSQGILINNHNNTHYVTDVLTRAIADPLSEMLLHHPETQDDILEFRLLLEGSCAYYAAQRATLQDQEQILKALEKLETSGSETNIKEISQADFAFHVAIVEATHNVVLLHAMRSMYSLIEHNINANMDSIHCTSREWGQNLLLQHKVLADAILARNPEKAKAAATHHLSYTRDAVHKESQTKEERLKPILSKESFQLIQ